MGAHGSRRARFRRRAAAAAVDAALILVLLWAWEGVLAWLAPWLAPRARTPLPPDWNRLGSMALVLLYFLPEALGARTPGKRLLRLHIAARDGSPPSAMRLWLRWTFKLSGVGTVLLAAALRFGWPMAGFALQRLGTLLIAWLLAGTLAALAPHRRALHDLATGTAVYRVLGGRAPRR